MGALPTCPVCGLASDDVRCPRCNALKVVGCTGSCTLCKESSACKTEVPSPPSDTAAEDAEHLGTPLTR